MIEPWTAAALALLTAQPDGAGASRAGEPPGEPPPAGLVPVPLSSLRVEILPGVWLPRLGGKASLGPGSAELDLALDFDLDDSEPLPNVEVTIRKGDLFELMFSGAGFSTEASGTFPGDAAFGAVVLTEGEPYRATFDLTSVGAELAINAGRPFTRDPQKAIALGNVGGDGRPVADLRIAPVLGARFVDVEQTLFSGGETATGEGEWTCLYGGLQVTLDYRPEVHVPLVETLRMQCAFGVGPALGGDGGTMWQVRGGLTVHMTETLGVMVGYRLLELDVGNDDYELRGGLQGLFLTASLRF